MVIAEFIPSPPVLLLGGAALAFYTASRAGAHVLTIGFRRHRTAAAGMGPSAMPEGDRAGAAAIAHWLPMAVVAIAAARHEPQMAVCLVFAGTLATLGLAMGTILFAAPTGLGGDGTTSGQRGWAMLLPAAVLALLIGFNGELTLRHAGILLVQGVVALLLWSDQGKRGALVETGHVPPVVERLSFGRAISGMVAWIALAVVGAALALRATSAMNAQEPRLTPGIIATLMLAPAMALPLIGSGLSQAREGRTSSAVGTCVGSALLNLCVLLPAVIATWHLSSAWDRAGSDAIIRGEWLGPPAAPLPFPAAVWRVDCVLLVMLGAFLVPIGAGRWFPKRIEGLGLMVLYALYLGATAAIAAR